MKGGTSGILAQTSKFAIECDISGEEEESISNISASCSRVMGKEAIRSMQSVGFLSLVSFL